MDSPPLKIPRLEDDDRVSSQQEHNPGLAQTLQEGNPLLAQTLQEGNPLLAQTLQEGNHVPAQNLQESNPVSAHTLQEGNHVSAQTLQEGNPVLAQTLQEVPPTQALETDKPVLTLALPEGWVTVAHESGGLVYLHKQSRVTTLSRPYHLPSSIAVKRHKIPVSAVPCIEKWPGWHRSNACTSTKKKGAVLLEPCVFNQYLSLRWPQGKVSVPAEFEESKRQHLKKLEAVRKKKEESLKQPSVPEAISKLVVVEVPKHLCRPGPDGKRSPQAWKVTLGTKASVNLLHEFCTKYLRSNLEFVIKETVPSSSLQQPFLCTAVIDSKPHGSGEGVSKRVAKQMAAENTLQSLLPGALSKLSSSMLIRDEEHQYFSTLPLNAPEAAMLLKQADLPSPWLILKEYCQRYRGCAEIFDEPHLRIDVQSSGSTAGSPSSLGLETSVSDQSNSLSGDTRISEVPSSLAQDTPSSKGAFFGDASSTGRPVSSASPRCIFQLTCGPDLCISGPCSGRKEAKQLGAQAMLQKLHPLVLHWGTLLEMYVDQHSHFSRVFSAHPTAGLTTSAGDSGSAGDGAGDCASDGGSASGISDDLLSVLRQEMRKLRK